MSEYSDYNFCVSNGTHVPISQGGDPECFMCPICGTKAYKASAFKFRPDAYIPKEPPPPVIVIKCQDKDEER